MTCSFLHRLQSFLRPAVTCSFAVVLLSACGTTAPVQTVRVPVPVVCQEPMPARPVMPTEGLRPPVTLDSFVAAAAAEIERREGYEGELVAALEACRAPLDGPSAGAAGGLGLKASASRIWRKFGL